MIGTNCVQSARPSNGVSLCSVSEMIQCPLLVSQLLYLVGLHTGCFQREFAEIGIKFETCKSGATSNTWCRWKDITKTDIKDIGWVSMV